MNLLTLSLLVALGALLLSRLTGPPWRGRLSNLSKAGFTVGAFDLLLTHPVAMEDGSKVIAWQLILDQLAKIDAGTFWLYVGLAAGIKFVGILASMRRWMVLLFGQGIELPFRHIFGSFLIGRFIGTFLPSTAGLDGYTLYDAARFSGRTVEVTAAKFLEKVIGIFGIFLSFLVALPFGIYIFGDNATLVAALTVPLAVVLIGGLLVVLWYPGLVEWLLGVVPLPGKGRLEGVVLRISNAAAAYRGKHGLVLQALVLSWVVHFTTAVMYYFTALAIGATTAEFWSVTFASSIQIFTTVISPFTIAGEGIREIVQYYLLKNQIGAGAAIVSAALGFWAAEALTLFGAYFWWFRPRDYTPAFSRVDGVQVDYALAARQALALESEEERLEREASPDQELPPFGARARLSAGYGLGAGVLAGLLIGLGESWAIGRAGFGGEAQVLWYAPLAYALLLGGLGAAGGAVLAVLPMDREEIRGWTPSLALIGTLIPLGLLITVFRVRRDLFAEQMPPIPVLLAILAGFGLLALLLFLAGPRLFRSRAGLLARPPVALGLLVAVLAIGALRAGSGAAQGAPSGAAEPAPSELPNLLLVMVDTLRADHLSCYGGEHVETPNLCRVAKDGGSIFDGFAHASWTKPSAATLVTSMVPSRHGVMSKPSALSSDIELLPELLAERGYRTGAIVSNTNLAPSFGFDQGYDEYHYLAPDYLFGAAESSSKLVIYQVARRVWFRFVPGLRFGDFYQAAEIVNEIAFDFLERRQDERFFLFLHYMDPHDPYFEHPWNGKGFDRATNQHPDAALAKELHALYVGEIGYLDQHFGELLAKLESLGLYENTVIALVSDHGEEFCEHGGFWHGLTLYDEQIRVPLLVKWAAGQRQAPANSRGYTTGLIDVAPTLLARAGARIPPAMQGVDLALPAGRRPAANQVVLSEEDHEGNVLRSLRTSQWKLIEANAGNPRGLPEVELFEVGADPAERSNVVERRPEQAAALRREADGQVTLAQSKAVEAEEAEVSASDCEALKALGYVQDCS